MKSIRIFLVVIIIATITLITFATLLHGYRQSMREAQNLFNDQLLQQAELLNNFPYLEDGQDIVAKTEPIIFDSAFANNHETATLAYQIFRDNKTLIARSSSAPVEPMQKFEENYSENNFNGYRWHTLALHNAGTGIWTIVAGREDVRYELAESVILESVLPIVAALPLMGVLIWLIISFGLKPIQHLAIQLRSKGATDLSPIVLDTVPKELTLLTTSANDLLKRLEASFEREKRFNSDVAHELRTPITALNIHLQNLVEEFDHPPETVSKLKRGVDRMNYLVEQILTLNRTEPDNYMAQFMNVDLFEISRKVVAGSIGRINDKRQYIEFQGESGDIYGDAFALEILVKNLLDNAVKYTPEAGRILIRITNSDDARILQIMDNGPGIPANQHSRVFERFYRVGGDQHESSVIGCGLGLSIVRHITELHDARLELGPSEFASGLCISIFFPLINTALFNEK